MGNRDWQVKYRDRKRMAKLKAKQEKEWKKTQKEMKQELSDNRK